MLPLFQNLRACWRLLRVALHLAGGAASVFCLFPVLARRWRLALKRRWSRQLLAILGVGFEMHGRPLAAMRVANHVSWLDIFAINAVTPSAFVAKQEVRGWPLIGWLCARTETIFMRRDSRRAAHATAGEVASALAAGHAVVVFPEGTTSDGRQVLPFHGALLEGAIQAQLPIQPITLRYAAPDARSARAPVYCGDTSLQESLWRIAAADGLKVNLAFLPPSPAAGCSRRMLAARLRDDIADCLHAGTPPRPQDMRTGQDSGDALPSGSAVELPTA